MSTEISDKRILKVIEGLTCGEINHGDLIGEVYKYAHLAGSCKNNHKSWVVEFMQTEKYLIESGIISKHINKG